MLFHILNVKRRLCIQKSTLESHGSLLWRKPDFAVSTQKTFKITQSFFCKEFFRQYLTSLKMPKKPKCTSAAAFPFPASLKCMVGFSLIIDDQRGAIRVENIQFSLHCTIHIKNTNLYSWIQIQENNKRQMQLCFRMYFCIHYIHTCNGYYSPKVDVVWQYRK